MGDNYLPFDTLREALGEKGKVMMPYKAMKYANPYYSQDFGEYSQNCQRCVVAYELRRRGYDVIALPTWEGDDMGFPYPTAKPSTDNGRWQMAFRKAKSVRVGINGDNDAAVNVVQTNIEKKMKKYGNGSRAVISVTWKGGTDGHVFNVENEHGKIIYRDAQSGRTVNIKGTLATAQTRNVNLVRTDNLRISDRAKLLVTRRRL